MMRIIIILGVFLGTICLFRNKINKLKMFSTVKTISCDRQNNYPKDFQYYMVYLYITYIFISGDASMDNVIDSQISKMIHKAIKIPKIWGISVQQE